MSSTKTQRLEIKDGPTADIIWTAAQYAYSKIVTVSVDFTLNAGLPQKEGVMWQHIFPKITGAIHEDGSGQSLNIEGYLESKYFSGYYNARRREGYIEVSL